MEEFRMNGNMVPVLPSHASHVLQPLDLTVFGVSKAALSKGDSSLRRLTLPDRRGAIMQKAMKALHLALCTNTIKIHRKIMKVKINKREGGGE
jgi:hypothetical protein